MRISRKLRPSKPPSYSIKPLLLATILGTGTGVSAYLYLKPTHIHQPPIITTHNPNNLPRIPHFSKYQDKILSELSPADQITSFISLMFFYQNNIGKINFYGKQWLDKYNHLIQAMPISLDKLQEQYDFTVSAPLYRQVNLALRENDFLNLVHLLQENAIGMRAQGDLQERAFRDFQLDLADIIQVYPEYNESLVLHFLDKYRWIFLP